MPEDRSDVDFWCTLDIGEVNSQVSDCFRVHVVTETASKNLESKNHLFVIPYYAGWEHTLELLSARVSEFSDVSWSGLAGQIAGIFHWEAHNHVC